MGRGEFMAKRISVKNEVSVRVSQYLEQHPKPYNETYMRKSALIEEVKYYMEEHEKASYPLARGILELQYDHASVIAIDNRPYQCQIIGIWDKAVGSEQKKSKFA